MYINTSVYVLMIDNNYSFAHSIHLVISIVFSEIGLSSKTVEVPYLTFQLPGTKNLAAILAVATYDIALSKPGNRRGNSKEIFKNHF